MYNNICYFDLLILDSLFDQWFSNTKDKIFKVLWYHKSKKGNRKLCRVTSLNPRQDFHKCAIIVIAIWILTALWIGLYKINSIAEATSGIH